MSAAIENFIFDLDGTLVDSLPGIEESVRFAVAHPIPPLRPLIGPPIRTILGRLEPGLREDELNELTARFRKAYDSTGWRDTVLQPGASELLAGLHKRGRRIFVVTNKPAFATRKILAMLAIRRYFAGVYTRDSRTRAFASKTEVLRSLVQREWLDPRFCVMVGDTVEDYVSAIETGMHAFIVANGYGGSPGIPAGCRLESLHDLLVLLYGSQTSSKGMPGQFPGQMPAHSPRGEIA